MADDSTDKTLRGRDLVGLGGLLVGVGLVAGLLIDDAAHTSPAFTLVGLALGMVGGGFGFWARVRAALRD
jgi:F0F1-type ATP synthase assembly protein I